VCGGETTTDADEGTAPTPGYEATKGKAELERLRSLARRNDRVQRKQILAAQRMLRAWHGAEHEPRLTSAGRQGVAILERTSSGEAFDQAFIEVFARHHSTALQSSTQCLAGRDPAHTELAGYRRGIVEARLEDIDQLRHTDCDAYDVCDYQPFGGVRGRKGSGTR
jgi:uncharacterized protein (DUF305 family)